MHGKFILFECLTAIQSMTEILGWDWTTNKVIEVFISPFNLHVFNPLEIIKKIKEILLFLLNKPPNPGLISSFASSPKQFGWSFTSVRIQNRSHRLQLPFPGSHSNLRESLLAVSVTSVVVQLHFLLKCVSSKLYHLANKNHLVRYSRRMLKLAY